jgi:hypothetical protein
MATGDTTDIKSRLLAVLPPWFGDGNPILNAVLTMAAQVLAVAYGLYTYAKDQTRIRTATGIWLDIIAVDFFGALLPRGDNEADDDYRQRILANLFRPRATRAAISDVITAVTGQSPIIIEPFSPADCGAYGVGYAGYGSAGAYGSVSLPAQAFVIASRPTQAGISNVAGYGFPQAGYGVGSQSEYATLSMMGAGVADADIYAAIANTKAAGVTIWAQIGTKHIPTPIRVNGSAFTLNGAAIIV